MSLNMTVLVTVTNIGKEWFTSALFERRKMAETAERVSTGAGSFATGGATFRVVAREPGKAVLVLTGPIRAVEQTIAYWKCYEDNQVMVEECKGGEEEAV